MAASHSSSIYPEYFTPLVDLDLSGPRDINVGNKVTSSSDINDFFSEIQTGGFSYKRREDFGVLCDDRFIFWRSYGTSLELMEQSYHYNFTENHVCLHLPSPILPSAAVHEVNEQCVLVTFATEESVYCILLSHPVEMHLRSARREEVPSVLSMLTQSSVSKATISHLHYGIRKRCVSVIGRKVTFALPSECSSVLVMQVDLDSQGGTCPQYEIQMSSLVQRLWSGIRGKQEEGSSLTSDLLLHELHTGHVLLVHVSGDMKLRMWLCKDEHADPILAVSVSELTGPVLGEVGSVRLARGRCTPSSLQLGLYCQGEATNAVFFYAITLDGDKLTHRQLSMYCIDKTFQLLDFIMSEEEVWLLGNKPQNQVVLHAEFCREPLTESVMMVKAPPEVYRPHRVAVQKAYLDAILCPRRFSQSVLLEVLNKCSGLSKMQDHDFGSLWWFRRAFVTAATEEMKAMKLGQDMPADQFLQFERQIWDMLYSYCCEAQLKRYKNGRLFHLDLVPHHGVGIVKMDSVAFVRAAPHGVSNSKEIDTICGCVQLIRDNISDQIFQEFLFELRYAEDLSFLKDYIAKVMQENPFLQDAVLSRLDSVENLVNLLKELNITLDCRRHLEEETKGVFFDGLFKPPYISLFGGRVAGSYGQMQSQTCLKLLLSYLVLYEVLRFGRPSIPDADFESGLYKFIIAEGGLRSHIHRLIAVWSVIHWMAVTPPMIPTSTEVENYVKVWKIMDCFNVPHIPEHVQRLPSYTSLLEMVCDSLSDRTDISCVSSDLWAETDASKIILCLFMNCQLFHIEHLNQMLRKLDVFDQSLIDFVLGQAHLVQGEYEVAQSLFLEFEDDVEDELDLSVEVYYSRLVQQLIHMKAHLHVISVLSHAVMFCDPRDPVTAVLWSNLFTQHLDLDQYQQAYQAMLSNPEAKRRKDCLRHFLNVLCDRGERKLLCSLEYPSLEIEVEDLLWMKARNSDLASTLMQGLYGLLFSFYITRRNYQKAASACYERACRIAREWEGPEALKQQVSALSVAVNNLSLVAAEDQWVKVYQGGRSRETSKTVGPLVKDLNEVRQEGLVALGLSKVKAKQSVRLTPVTNPVLQGHEASQALIKEGDYTRAYAIVARVGLPLAPFFETLVVQLGKGKTFHPLKVYLEKCDKRYLLVVLEAIFRQFMTCRWNHPAWFVKDYFEKYYPVELAKEYTSFNLLEESYDALFGVLTDPKYKTKHFTAVESTLEHLLFRLKKSVEKTGDEDQKTMIQNLQVAYGKFHS